MYIKSKNPDFLGIGVAKSGTTRVARLLAGNEDIFIPERKELHYFDSARFKNNYFACLKYRSNFPSDKICGEFTPSYIFDYNAPGRIRTTLGKDVKFLLSLRNPVDRAYSHYCHAINNWGDDRFRKLGYPIEQLSFREAILSEESRLLSADFHPRHLSYFSKGLYSEQIRRYFKFFSRSNFFIYTTEELSDRESEVISSICDFLGVKNSSISHNTNYGRNSQTLGDLSPDDYNWLLEKYMGSIIDLECLLERDFSSWKLYK